MPTVESMFEMEPYKLNPNSPRNPRRLLLVPNLFTIATPHVYAGVPQENYIEWDPSLLREVMEWSDVRGTAGDWSRAIFATPGYRHTDYAQDFSETWHNWSVYMRATEHLRLAGLNADRTRPSGLGADDTNTRRVSVMFHDEGYFQRWPSQHEAWLAIIRDALPGCVIRDPQIETSSIQDLFAAGRVRRDPLRNDVVEQVAIPYRIRVGRKFLVRARVFRLHRSRLS